MAENGRPSASVVDSLGRGTVVMVLGTIALFILNFVGRLAVARHLGPELFGTFNLGLSLAGLLSLVALLGLSQAVARTVAESRDPETQRRVIRFGATVTAVSSTLISIAVYLLAKPLATLFDPEEAANLAIVFQLFSVTVGLTLLCNFLAAVFQGFEDTVPNAWINQAVQPGAFVVFVYIFFAFHLELTGALIAWVLSNVATFVALLIYTWRRLPKHLPSGPHAKRLPSGLMTLSLSLWGVSTLTFVTAYIDTLILGHYRPEQQVGIYSATMLLARLILAGSWSISYILLPVTARLSGQGDYDTIRSSYVTTSRWVLIFTMPLFLVFALLPGNSITLVFGKSYAPGALALVVITTAALASVVVGPVNVCLAGLAATRPLLIATAVSAVSNVVLSLTLTPYYGIMGAAIAWSVARVLYPATGAFALWSDHRVTAFRRTFVLPLAVSLAIGIPLFVGVDLLPHPSWVVVPMYFVGIGIFLVALFVTRTVEKEDIVIVRMAERVVGRPLPKLERFLLRFVQEPNPLPTSKG